MKAINGVGLVDGMIMGRRTVKPTSFSPERLADNEVQELLEMANWAPTHGKTEPWRFHVYSGAGRERLARILRGVYEQAVPEAERSPEALQKILQPCHKSSHVIVLLMQRGTLEKIRVEEEICAVACAAQNLMLAATARGIGSIWSTGGVTYLPGAKEAFGMHGPQDRLLGFIYLGRVEARQEHCGARRSSGMAKTIWVDKDS